MNLAASAEKWITHSRWRLSALLVVFMILPIALFSYSISRMMKSQAETEAITESTQIGRVSAKLVEEHFHNSSTFLESFATRRTLREAWKKRDLDLVNWHLQQAAKLRPDFAYMGVYETDGTIRAISWPESHILGMNYAHRDWYKGLVRRWEPYVSEVYRSAVAPHALVMAIAVPIKDDDGNPIGVFMGAIALDSINQRLMEAKLEGGWAVSLVDQNGHLSARQNIDSSAPLVDLSTYKPVQEMREGHAGNGTYDRDGGIFFTRYEPVSQYGWGVLIEQPLTAVHEGGWAVERRVWILGLVFVVLGLLVSGFMRSLYSKLETGNRFMDLSIDMFCIAGFDGYFKSVNPIWAKTIGFTSHELTSKPFMEFIHPEDRGSTQAERDGLEKGETTIAFENRYQCKDGSYKWFSWNAVAVPEQGLMYAVARDVTQVKNWSRQISQKNQELALRNREVERATQLKSRFLASMSHELRTPLNAIVGFSDLLSEETAGELNEKQKRFVGHIKQGSAHLLQLINDILDLSKIEAGQLEMRLEDFKISDALPEVLSTIRPLAMTKNIEVDFQPGTERPIHADRVRFKQILYNLLSNAVKFTPKGGRVTIDCSDKDNFVSVSVTDTGIGIRSEDQAVVFDEFRQVEGTETQAHEGTGLGLSITKRLVERQGGVIALASLPGKGSCFTFTLPAGAKLPQTQPLTAALGSTTSELGGRVKPLILVVDDEAPARELLASYLESDYQVAVAESGAAAIRLAQQLVPDVITLDVLMTGGTGFETLIALRKAEATATIPIIIVSIVDQKQVGFALGAADYLIKPIRKPELLDAIRKHVPSGTDDDATVLLVDDDPSTLDLLQETLRAAGYETQSVQSGARALEVLSAKQVNAVLLDLLMPGMDGFQVIRRLRQEPALRDLPVLVMTGKNLSADEISLLNRDTQAVLDKNGSWQEHLTAEVRRVVRAGKRAKGVGHS